MADDKSFYRVKIRTYPPDLFFRLRSWDDKMIGFMDEALKQSLEHVNERVPPYPPQLKGQTYIRTGDLAKSLGSTMGGGVGSVNPSIYKARRLGSRKWTGNIGTNIRYSERVIGLRQASPFSSYWWNVDQWAKKSRRGIARAYTKAADKITAWLGGRDAL
jgi:hypothetical protein